MEFRLCTACDRPSDNFHVCIAHSRCCAFLKFERRSLVLFILLFALPDAWAAQGWYLIHPPLEQKTVRSGKNIEFNPRAPLRQWKQVSAHDTAPACEAAKSNLLSEARKSLDEARKELSQNKGQVPLDSKNWVHYQEENLAAAMAARCIASDDPRLK